MNISTLLLSAALTASPVADGLFEPGLVSDNGAFGFTLSPDGQHALWVQSGGGRTRLVIVESRKVDGKWQAPTPVPFTASDGSRDIDPAFAPDGKSIIFQSNRPVPDKPARKGFDIYSVALQDGRWGPLQHLGHDINGDDSESSGSITADGTIYFMKNGAEGKSDLWRSRRVDGKYGVPERVAEPVNTGPWRESNPYIAADESYLLYFSDAPGGAGDVDLYISFKEKDGWSAPRNLGAPFNTAQAEFTPWVHGKRLYLARQVKDGERFIENIYSYPFDPERYRDTMPAAMKQAATTLLQDKLLHATSIAVVHRGQQFILHQGELETGKANPPTDATLYEIGSVSKTFAGLLLADAVVQGKASLNDPIQKYLPSAYPNLQSRGQPIRLQHLITHTSGMPGMLPLKVNTLLKDFPRHATPGKLNLAYASYGQRQFWQDLHRVSIKGPLGKDYAYSSAGTELVAYTLEKIHGVPYETQLTTFLAREAGMRDTKLRLAASEAQRLAPGYHSDNPVATTPMPQLPWGAAGNLKATMPDMAQYLRLQLGSHPAVLESHRPLVRFTDDFSIAYFWNIGDSRQLGKHYVHHGGVPRAQSYAFIVPKYQLGVFIVTNQSGTGTAKSMETALAHIFDAAAALDGNAK